MENEKKVYRRASDRSKEQRPGALLIVFAVLLFGFSLLNLFWPKRTASELENRVLSSLPSFQADSFVSGKWGANMASYVQDQVALRDQLLWLESAVSAVGLQKVEEGGILLGKDGWMFTEQFSFTTGAQLERNLSAVETFVGRTDVPVTFLLAPSAAVIYADKLPAGAPMIDENAMLDDIFGRVSQAGAAVLDLREDYAAHKNDANLYYTTDHHWTTGGAYRAYLQFCLLRGLTPFDTGTAEAVTVPDFYGTHYSATRRWNVRPDALVYYPLPVRMTLHQVKGEAQFEAEPSTGLLNEEKLAGRDKYGAFLDGNHGYTTVEGRGKGSILVVKDSYANCFVPFLTENYARIGVVDFRGYSYSPDSLITREGYDEVLILYNFQTFVGDTNVINFARPSSLSNASN